MEHKNSAKNSLCLSALGWERSDSDRLLQTFSRNYFRLHFITGGTGYYKTVEETIKLSEGEGFIIFPGTTPSYFPSKEQPWEYFWAAIQGSDMDELVSKKGITRTSPAFRSVVPVDEMRKILADMCATSIMPLAVDRVFPYYLRDFFQKIEAFSPQRKKNALHLELCLAYIAENYSLQITVHNIAEFARIDRTYLYKLFVQNLGVSPQVYLLNYRITKAGDLLRTTDRSITDIAYSVGFRDFSTFSRQFKNKYKTTPTKYREHNI